ncbi:hypothetical protein G6M89_19245 [Natronolimnobius sp. AArcel1]|uniref:hypothetical protein n=1 Tax=Natronolimnobius sp. AArcel1 TaxID=1679093 RepID=UPI0013EAD146|nr:hypothetical protein [Natronolimnobius sp. AArcel1]NGM71111.1 hypothetical protein [Natronolimnobius sp. AArcel1]
MVSFVFQLVALVIVVFGLAQAAFPRQMSQWEARGPAGETQIQPGPMRLVMMRVMGLVVAVVALLVVFGSPSLLF